MFDIENASVTCNMISAAISFPMLFATLVVFLFLLTHGVRRAGSPDAIDEVKGCIFEAHSTFGCITKSRDLSSPITVSRDFEYAATRWPSPRLD